MKRIITFLTALSASILAIPAVIPDNARGAWVETAQMGDINGDGEVSAADLIILEKHIMGIQSITKENTLSTGGRTVLASNYGEIADREFIATADMNHDDRIDVFDMVELRSSVINRQGETLSFWEDTPTDFPFIEAPIYDLYGSMPSQGKSTCIAFYVDFPDCPYDYEPSMDEIKETIFGEENTDDSCYPFDTIHAYFERSSKGVMQLEGDVFRYTTKNSKSYYENDVWHVALIDELIANFQSIDWTRFDSDSNNEVDSILVSVPNAAGDDDWWPTAGIFGGERKNRCGGLDVGHVIVGNAQINEGNDHDLFVGSYCHEMGHCMGLLDYYYTDRSDFQGMHGSAGFELMDDAICDLGAASKLQLGWYRENQIFVYNNDGKKASYTLANAQTDDGNCVIIPLGTLGEKYRSEYFIMEYITEEANNSNAYWWKAHGSGVRVYHIEATVDPDDYWRQFLYANKKLKNHPNDHRQFITLVNEGDDATDNLFRTGDVITSDVKGFCWYDSSGYETVKTGLKITIGELTEEGYSITIEAA